MPVQCPSCGTQNADGAQFCQNCRTPLAAAAAPPQPAYPPPPQPGYAPQPAPGYAQPGYPPPGQSPYYQQGAATTVHRTPTGLIVGGGIAVFFVIAVLAIFMAFAFSRPATAKTASHSLPTPAPTAQPTAQPSGQPTAQPTAKPTAQPTANPGGGAAIETNTFSLGLASGWKKVKADNVSAVVANDTGSIFVLAGRQDHDSSVDNEFTGIVSQLKQKYPDVASCTKPAAFTIDGVNGVIWGFNYIWTSPGGRAVKVCDVYFLAVPDNDKSYLYEMEEFMADSDFDKFANGQAKDELVTLKWKAP